ncbi:hypothetical protein D3C86_877120 [compost metagenome]
MRGVDGQDFRARQLGGVIGGGGGGLDRQIVELVRRARADQQHRVGVDARRCRNHQAAVGAAGEAAVRHRLGQSARRGGVEGRARPGQRTSVMDQDGKDFGGAGGSDELDFHETYSRPRFCAPVVLESDMGAPAVSPLRSDVYYMARIARGCNSLAPETLSFRP